MLVARYTVGNAEYFGLLQGEHLHRLRGAPWISTQPAGPLDRVAEIEMLAPLRDPRVFAVGMNYVGHIAEAGVATPEIPLIFMMPNTAVIGPGASIILPREAQVVHHECELAIVIGRKGRRIPREHVPEYVFGYTCANDVSERSIQNREMASGALLMGKSFDTFCPLGPVIATNIDAGHLKIQTRVNGELRQEGDTADLLFDIGFLVSYLSQAITLLPGDIILTGTPSGVGPLVPGDLCEISIENIGTLANRVVAEATEAV